MRRLRLGLESGDVVDVDGSSYYERRGGWREEGDYRPAACSATAVAVQRGQYPVPSSVAMVTSHTFVARVPTTRA